MRHAIVGVGFGASAHLPAFLGLDGVEVVGLADSGSGRAAGFRHPGLTPYTDWRRMLDEARPDSISVVVPPPSQLAIVETALARGIHVLCEKPLGLSADEAGRMAALASGAGLVGAVAMQFRFEPGMAALREQIRRVGRVRRLDFSWITSGRADPSRPWSWQHDAGAGGGVLYAFLPHAIDLVRWLSRAEISGATARTTVLVAERPDHGAQRVVTAEDMVDAVCELGDGAVASLRVTNCQPSGEGMRIEVHGEQGVLTYAHRPPFDGAVELRFRAPGLPAQILDPGPPEAYDSRITALGTLARHFVDAVEGMAAVDLPTFADGLQAQRVIGAMRRSAAAGRFERS